MPMSRAEMDRLGWRELDVLFITGDAYVDHPAFGTALLGRYLIANGYKTGIIAQPSWDNFEDIKKMGCPSLFVGVSAGALDSMLAHYTAFRKKRHDDAYTPGGKAGRRPNRAVIVYANMVRRVFPGLPLVIGGIEASLRRASHYDFWTDSLRRSVIFDSRADLLAYGMGERSTLEIAERLEKKLPVTGIAGTAHIGRREDLPADAHCITLPAHEEILANPRLLMDATLKLERQVHLGTAHALQMHGERSIIFNPPAAPLSAEEMDSLYALPFSREAHPSYTDFIPAQNMLKTSITSHRGCGGGCSFCSLALHQGRLISSRSEESILHEVEFLAETCKKPVSISDIGGPTANMWQGGCALRREVEGEEGRKSRCLRRSCCWPDVCPSFMTSPKKHVSMLRKAASMADVGQVRIASGIRADLAVKDPQFWEVYVREFTGGQLKMAPEHCNAEVLELMRKPSMKVFEQALREFKEHSRAAGLKQFVIPYLMSAFPGCTDAHMAELGRWLKRQGWRPQQVQCFTPTPGTVATAMYYAGIDEKGREIFVARRDAERIRQHKIITLSYSGRSGQQNS